MIEVGIDTSVLIGLLDPKDVWHNAATALKEALQAHQANIAVFDCVLAEAIGTMARPIYDAPGPVRQRGVHCTFPKATMVPPPDEGLRRRWLLPPTEPRAAFGKVIEPTTATGGEGNGGTKSRRVAG